MFVQIHLLSSIPPHLPNRDRSGLAKRSVLGGIERQRISSQCCKRVLRAADGLVRSAPDGSVIPDTMRDLAERLGLGMSVRSAVIGEKKLRPALIEVGLAEGDAQDWSNAVMALWRKEKDKDESKETDEPADSARAAPLVVGEQEIALLVDVVRACLDDGLSGGDLRELVASGKLSRDSPVLDAHGNPVLDKKGKPKTKKAARALSDGTRSAVEALRAARQHAGLDGALFGRFATGAATSTVERAVTVGEMVSVHPIRSIPDFFSATDDLSEGPGGSHIGTRELTEMLGYQHLVIDVGQIERNTGCSRDQAAEIAAWIGRAVAQTGPLGTRRAPAQLVDMVVEVGRRQPRTLAGAFEIPVQTAPEARQRLQEALAESDDLLGKPDWRGAVRDHGGQAMPAVEALMESAREMIMA
jgi:CRISPR system Cascade subunit CasC